MIRGSSWEESRVICSATVHQSCRTLETVQCVLVPEKAFIILMNFTFRRTITWNQMEHGCIAANKQHGMEMYVAHLEKDTSIVPVLDTVGGIQAFPCRVSERWLRLPIEAFATDGASRIRPW
jgi:hypothetical protein